MGILPDGAGAIGHDADNTTDSAGSTSSNELLLGEALRTKEFWMLCVIAFMAMFCTESIMIHLVPHAIDINVRPDTAATILSTLGAASMAGRVIMGIAGDRIGRRSAMIICFSIMTAGLVWLQFAEASWMLFLFALAQGFAHGTFFALISPVTADLFGLKAQGVILGIIYFAGTAGGSLGPYLAGRIFDTNQTYTIFFLICLALAFSAALLMTVLKKTSVKATA